MRLLVVNFPSSPWFPLAFLTLAVYGYGVRADERPTERAPAELAFRVADGDMHVDQAADPTRIRLVATLSQGVADALPEDFQLEQALQLHVVANRQSESFPVLGRWQRNERELSFVPRYSLVPGLVYRGVLKLPGSKLQSLDYEVPPANPLQRPRVTRIEPTGDTLPANALKFYIHFSQPMREGRKIFQHFQLLDESGEQVPDPWRHVELWNDDATRLTLWIHPGRVKQGVNLRRELGPVLTAGHDYTLKINPQLQDAAGRTLVTMVTKRFAVREADHTRPLPRHWQLQVPPARTRLPLRVQLGEPLDAALLHRMLLVRRADGTLVSGTVELHEGETEWHFKPDQPWADEPHTLRVNRRLEDLAGNTPERVFDTDTTEAPPSAAKLERAFRPAPR